MEKICLENIISGLMFIGFDKVDSLLLGYVTEGVLNSDLYHFVLEDDAIPTLYNHIDYLDGVYKFQGNEDIDSIVKLKNFDMTMKSFLALHSNKKLIECLKTLNYKDIVMKKISSIGIENIDDMNNLFSLKEKEIIMNIFGITLNNSKGIRR